MATHRHDEEAASDTMTMVRATSRILPLAGPQIDHFWQAQDVFLDEGQAFAQRWFTRRHEGTRSAMKAMRDLLTDSAGRPARAVSVLSDWQRHSFERAAEDYRDWTDLCARSAKAAFRHETEASAEAAKAVTNMVADTSGGKHATPV